MSGRRRLRAIVAHAAHAKDRHHRYQLAHHAGWLVGYHGVDTRLFCGRQRRSPLDPYGSSPARQRVPSEDGTADPRHPRAP
jgi:hypothetical protein